MSAGALPPRAKAAPVLVLCRQCIRYVFDGTLVCPHCHGDARTMSDRYRDEGYLGIETMLRIDRLREAAEEKRAVRDQ